VFILISGCLLLQEKKRKEKRYTTGIGKERMLFCVLHHPIDAETRHFHLKNTNERFPVPFT
jgi:hypothetical protein